MVGLNNGGLVIFNVNFNCWVEKIRDGGAPKGGRTDPASQKVPNSEGEKEKEIESKCSAENSPSKSEGIPEPEPTLRNPNLDEKAEAKSCDITLVESSDTKITHPSEPLDQNELRNVDLDVESTPSQKTEIDNNPAAAVDNPTSS